MQQPVELSCFIQRPRDLTDFYLDIETLDMMDKSLPERERLARLRVGLAWSYCPPYGWHLWDRFHLNQLEWEFVNKCVIGFRVLGFDLPVISYNTGRPDAPSYHKPQFVIDIWEIVNDMTGRWVGLDELAEATLGIGKAEGIKGKGAPALLTATENVAVNWGTVIDYCRRDVELTIRLWEHVRAGGALVIPPHPTRDLNTYHLWIEERTA